MRKEFSMTDEERVLEFLRRSPAGFSEYNRTQMELFGLGFMPSKATMKNLEKQGKVSHNYYPEHKKCYFLL